jgi:tetratricopeptide (TPR) repeat protein
VPKSTSQSLREPIAAPGSSPSPVTASTDPMLHRPAGEAETMRARITHDRLLEDALDLERQARGNHHETPYLLRRALERVADAMQARPSFDATKLEAELHLDLAGVVAGDAAVAEYEAAARAYETAQEMHLGNLDVYMGLGWAHLELARLRPDPALDFAAAVAVMERAAELAHRNPNVLRIWGAAVDGLARVVVDGAPEADARFRQVAGAHPVIGHELVEWYSTRRAAAEWEPIAKPPLRDV